MTDRSLIRLDKYAREDDELSDIQLNICERIMLGESVIAICRDDDMPARSTVMGWIAKDPAFRAAYSAAKAMLAEAFAEEIIEISDDASGDWVDGETGKELDREHVQRSRLRVDSRKWLAAKLAPKRYGEASMIRVGDLDGDRRNLSPGEMFSRLAAMAAAAQKEGK